MTIRQGKIFVGACLLAVLVPLMIMNAQQQPSFGSVPLPNWMRPGVPATNNECPVCGTMAEKYVRPKGLGSVYAVPQPGDPPGTASVVGVRDDGKPYGPPERLARCKRCNAAFWQDSEDEKR